MIFFRRFAVHVVFDILILLIVPFDKKIFWQSLPDGDDCIREKKCFGSPVLKYSYHDSSVFASKKPKHSIICFAHSKAPVELAVIRLLPATDGLYCKNL